MTITFFSHSEGSYRKPFIEQFMLDNPTKAGETHAVEEVSRTRKQTGYMLHTRYFSIFLFEDAKITGDLLQALEVYVSNHKGYELVVNLVDKSPYYQLGVDSDKPVTWLYGAGKYTRAVMDGSDLEQHHSNPFLPSPTQNATATTTRKRNPLQTS